MADCGVIDGDGLVERHVSGDDRPGRLLPAMTVVRVDAPYRKVEAAQAKLLRGASAIATPVALVRTCLRCIISARVLSVQELCARLSRDGRSRTRGDRAHARNLAEDTSARPEDESAADAT
jgi:ribosomal protein S26